MEGILGSLIVLFLIPIIPATIANLKGRNFSLWYRYSLYLLIISNLLSLLIGVILYKHVNFILLYFCIALLSVLLPIIYALIISSDPSKAGTRKKCPYCAEYVKKEANVCRFCGNQLTENKKKE